ncbi:MAG: hypothetical protein KAY24_17330, partial [Candidatus Eisenbacteria sp.]|nr:hypothetical protein [Candidatus Eisenbacteria bacterium]
MWALNSDSTEPSRETIATFLHFGFLPRVSSDVLDEPWAKLLGAQQDAEQATTEEYSILVKRGECILRSLFETPAGNHHIVPLSGGLDSRAILGGLLTAGLKDRITTITFGAPGTYDLEIGRYVARRMGLRNELIDLTQVPLKQQFLQETVSEGAAWTWLFDGFYQRQIAKRFGKEVTFWSGYMGEALTGKDLRP